VTREELLERMVGALGAVYQVIFPGEQLEVRVVRGNRWPISHAVAPDGSWEGFIIDPDLLENCIQRDDRSLSFGSGEHRRLPDRPGCPRGSARGYSSWFGSSLYPADHWSASCSDCPARGGGVLHQHLLQLHAGAGRSRGGRRSHGGVNSVSQFALYPGLLRAAGLYTHLSSVE